MNTQNAFQQRFPLSAKKFTKKMLPEFFGGLFLSIFLAVFPVAIFAALNANNQSVGTDNLFPVLLHWYITSFILIYIVRTIIYAIYWKAYIRTYFYDCGQDFVTIRKNVFTPSEIHVQYPKIQDVYVDQDLLDRFLGIYDVHIASATVSSGIEAHIDGVDKAVAESIKDLLLSSIKNGATPNEQQGSVPLKVQTPTPVKVSIPENISSETYPILPSWIIQKTLTTFFGTFGGLIIMCIFFFSGTNNNSSSSSSDLGLTFSSALPYLVILFVVLFGGGLIYSIIWKRNYKFKLLPEYIYVYTGVITNQEQHIPYDRIQDVIVRQNFFEKIIGLSSVYIQNAAVGIQVKNKYGVTPMQGIMIPGQSMESSKALSEIIRGVLVQKNQNTGL